KCGGGGGGGGGCCSSSKRRNRAWYCVSAAVVVEASACRVSTDAKPMLNDRLTTCSTNLNSCVPSHERLLVGWLVAIFNCKPSRD
ncbi:hypothetical protein BLOT_008870, partial [Blomia tropicalis]